MTISDLAKRPRLATARMRASMGSPGMPDYTRGSIGVPGMLDYTQIPPTDDSDDEVSAPCPRRLFNTLGDVMEAPADPDHWSEWFAFVQKGRFQLLAGGIILINTMMIAAELQSPALGRLLYCPEQVCLSFYVFELLSRVCFLRGKFLCGPRKLVVWHVLDVAVVCAGVLDQWLLPLFPSLHQSAGDILGVLRLLRLVRVLKLVRLLLEANLAWADEPPFQSFIGGVIALNSILMGFETDILWEGWSYFEQVLLLIYVFELAVRLKRDRWGFFYERDVLWNLMDFTIVVSAIVDQWLVPISVALIAQHKGKHKNGQMRFGQVMMLMRMLRLMRILRLVRLVKSVRPLYDMVMGVVAAFQGVFWTLVLTVVLLYAFGIVATRLVGHGIVFPDKDSVDPTVMKLFATVPDSMFLLFKVMSGTQTDGDAHAVEVLMGEIPAVKFVFVSFMVASSWTLLSILTAVVSENMISTTREQKKFLKITNAEHDRKQQIRALSLLFASIDADHNGTLEPEELEEYLQDPKNRDECAHLCRVPATDVVEVIEYIRESCGGDRVDMKRFMACLTIVGEPTTEKSVMKLEARFNKLEALNRNSSSELREITQAANQESSRWQNNLLLKLDRLDHRFGSFEKKQEAWQQQQAQEKLLLDSRLHSLENRSSGMVAQLEKMLQQQGSLLQEMTCRTIVNESALGAKIHGILAEDFAANIISTPDWLLAGSRDGAYARHPDESKAHVSQPEGETYDNSFSSERNSYLSCRADIAAGMLNGPEALRRAAVASAPTTSTSPAPGPPIVQAISSSADMEEIAASLDGASEARSRDGHGITNVELQSPMDEASSTSASMHTVINDVLGHSPSSMKDTCTLQEKTSV